MSTPSKSQRAYQAVHDAIVSGRYSPGFRLVLGDIATSLGISVVPVREALRRLEAEGLVTFERNIGARVAEIAPQSYQETMETLAIVEGAALAIAVDTLTAADLSEARRLNERMRETLDHFDPVRFTMLNEAFHRSLTDACRNQHLKGVVDAAWQRLSQLRQSTFSFVPGRAHASVEEHERILRLVEERAPAAQIEHAVREHRLATPYAYFHRDEATERRQEHA